MQVINLRLAGDTSVGGASRMGITKTASASSLDMGGYTLTKSGAGQLVIVGNNTIINPGDIEVTGGSLTFESGAARSRQAVAAQLLLRAVAACCGVLRPGRGVRGQAASLPQPAACCSLLRSRGRGLFAIAAATDSAYFWPVEDCSRFLH